MKKRDFLTYALIACLSAAGGVASFFYQNKPSVKTAPKYTMNKHPIGSLIPNLALTDVQQKKSALYNYKTDYVLINFWATWCHPCRREMPILKKLADNNPNLSVLGFAYDNQAEIIKFQKQIGINYPLFLSSPQTTQLNALFGNSSGGLPYTVLLNKEHKIIMTQTGEITEKQILDIIK